MQTTQLEIPTTAGTPFGGGIYAGTFSIGRQVYALIVAPADVGELEETAWGKRKTVPAAESYCDGLTNTNAMAEAGSELGTWARALRIGDHADWYIPSRLESLIAFSELRAAEIFAREWYWTSTQYASYSDYAWFQYFDNGYQYYGHKDTKLRARAVRRLVI